VRFLMFTATDRPAAARAMLDSSPEWLGGAERVAMWRKVLDALETRTASAIESARTACLAIARKIPDQVNDVVMIMGALGDEETAFAITEGFLLWRGKIVNTNQADGKAMDDYSRRMTQWLFTPPLAAMRRDPRFQTLCEEFGLSAYWRGRGVRPDYQVYER